MAIKLTQEQIINQFREKHGNKYDYSLVEYINSRTKVKIKCFITPKQALLKNANYFKS